MRYNKTDTLPHLPLHEMHKEGLELTADNNGWKVSDKNKAHKFGLKVDDEGYLLK